MASGHANRANRPNTWLLRPMLQREDSSCQPGAVHTWPFSDMTSTMGDVRSRGQNGSGADRLRLRLLTHIGLSALVCAAS
jgi:hypothetical protein